MHRHDRTELVPLTEPLAREFADMPAPKGERPKRAQRKDYLFAKIQQGLFHPPRWAKAFVVPQGRWLRVNGQHSSAACLDAATQGIFPQGMQVIIDHFVCDTVADLVDLFCQFDAPASARSATEIIMAAAREIEALDEVPPSTIVMAVTGVATYMNETGTYDGRVTPDYKRGLLADHVPFIRWTREFAGRAKLKHYGAVAAMAATHEADQARAATFWRAVRDESNPVEEHPTRKLGRFLDLVLKKAAFDKNDRPWSTRAILAKCVHAWNAGDGSTNLNYVEDAPLPKARGPQKVKEAA